MIKTIITATKAPNPDKTSVRYSSGSGTSSGTSSGNISKIKNHYYILLLSIKSQNESIYISRRQNLLMFICINRRQNRV